MKKIPVLLLLVSAWIFPSCKDSTHAFHIGSGEGTAVGNGEGSCPFLTKDNDGHVVLSWIKKIDSSTSVYCYAVSKDGGRTFGKATDIPGSENVHPHGENMPKIIFKTDGEVIAAWAAANPNPKNPYADIVYYALSPDGGLTWAAPVKLVQDSAGYDQRYFDMALLPGGEAAISWLDNRKKTTGEGSALYFAETSGHAGFGAGRLVSEPCCPCCRTDLFVDSKKNIHILYRAILNDSIRDMVHTVSSDNGQTFSAPERISKDNWVINGCPHTGPAMTESREGIHFAWFTGGGDGGTYYCRSGDNGRTFSEREKVSGVGSRHCQITTTARDQIVIAWNENFFSGHQSSSRIGIEVRDAKGSHPVTEFITPASGYATFPAVVPLKDDAVVVAYTESSRGKDRVMYKRIGL